MRWDAIPAPPDKLALTRDLIERVPASGWRRHTLAAASACVLSDPDGWRDFFPKGSRDAIWFVSTLSDASMKLAFATAPAPKMSTVIVERLDQNRDLKPFVRQVMLFDLIHPIPALARMDRTARVMFECLAARPTPPSRAALIALNLVYTAIVFVWLFDHSQGDAFTRSITPKAMRLVGLS
jgi:hypothetical protein